MNLLNRMMSYDKTKVENQENCNCAECVSENVKSKNQIIEYPKLSEEEIEQIVEERYFDKDKKTKEFIRKALRKHGDRYDYSNVIYVNNNTKVEIICPKHDSFPQTPHSHKQGCGCRKCYDKKSSNNRKMTLEEFIEKSNIVHGKGTYNYSKVIYADSQTEVIIICPKHGEFPQRPNNHLQGQGCRKCQYDKLSQLYRMTLEEFIEKANEVHGIGQYDYSKVVYVNNHTEVIIICPKHSEFPQTPEGHLQGQGCPKCKSSKGELIIRKFLIKHKIEFEEQKRFKDCRNINPLPFDFYISQYNLCIEYDGIQHFIIHDFGSKRSKKENLENFKQLQFRDQIKNNYCEKNGINLLRIRYDEDIEEKIMNYFQNNI